VAKQRFVPNKFASDSPKIIYLTPVIISLAIVTTLLDPFNSPKLWLLILLSAWLFGHILIHLRRDSGQSTRMLTFLIIFFLASLLFAALFSENLQKAFFGETQRRTGILFYIGMAIFMLGSALFANRKLVLNFYVSATCASLILLIYGFIQYLGQDPISWENPYNSIILTLGNPNYSSALMSILTILLFAFALHLQGLKRLLLFVVGIGLIVLIVLSNSRQGIISFAFGINILVLTFLFKRSIKIGIIYTFFAIASAIFVILGMLQSGPLEKYVYKTSVSIRGYYWRAGIDMFFSKPFTGVGIDSYGDYFKQFRNSEYPLRFGFQITSDNAHNVPIQLLATGGIFVGLSYFLLTAYIFWRGIKVISSAPKNETFLLSGLFGAWFAYVAQSIISIDNVGLTIWGWIIGGIIVGISYAQNNEVAETNKSKSLQELNLRSVYQKIYSAIFLLPVIFIVSLHFQVEKDMYKIASLGASVNATSAAPYNNEILYDSLIRGSNLKLLDSSHKLTIAALLRDNGNIKEYEKVISDLLLKDPRCLTCLKVRGEVYEINKDWANAVQTYNQISLLDPWNAENYLRIANVYAVLGQKQDAISALDKILSFAGNTQVGIQALEGKKMLTLQ
jgi:O-antigen ligase